ncbi:MAG: hypothetical protein LRZ99_01690 [Desulfotomaculum sp.]|nr:hypothetical protein [Desulfotomaculum sp.]MCL0080668.1 hypothetical protein [Peptococcaceae bacterium]
MENTKIEYVLDKETKGTFRFKPADEEIIGNATIYLKKDFVQKAGIDPKEGFVMTITAK